MKYEAKDVIKDFLKFFKIIPFENNKQIFYNYKTEQLQLNSYEKFKIEVHREMLKERFLF